MLFIMDRMGSPKAHPESTASTSIFGLSCQHVRTSSTGPPKNVLGVGRALGAPFPTTPPFGRGLQGPALCFPYLSCIFQIIGFSYHSAKPPCHLLGPFVNCRIPRATLEMQAQTSAQPQSQCQCLYTTEKENRPQHFEIVGGKISGICIEEIGVWPLVLLSATPPPKKFAGVQPTCDHYVVVQHDTGGRGSFTALKRPAQQAAQTAILHAHWRQYRILMPPATAAWQPLMDTYYNHSGWTSSTTDGKRGAAVPALAWRAPHGNGCSPCHAAVAVCVAVIPG